ncbi:GtrA family protein [Streptomyces sp. MMBL 11-3]|uniref:GtrA family protein n=1 Tax=Streptomyces sp. MMBL 11-3 TaxID=3382639 RepID=UPI0039B5FC26
MESQRAAETVAGGTGPGTGPGPGPFASFVRFVVCGGGVGVLSSGAVALLAGSVPFVVANAVVTVVSTLLCTELHALFTFGTGGRAGWRRHWQSAGSAAVAYAATSLAVLALHELQTTPSALTGQVVYLGASGAAGVGRFLALRWLVFAPTSHPLPANAKGVTAGPSPAGGWGLIAQFPAPLGGRA